MLKKIIIGVFVVFNIHQSISQVLYNQRFNALSLNTATYSANNTTQSYLYADVPSGMFTINDGNLVADTLSGNYPFRANGQKQKAWLSYKAANLTDTFAVSTSWLNPTGTRAAWLITPTINNITANTVLTWDAMAPDAANLDGYEVYVSTNTSFTPVVSDFTSILYSTPAENKTWTTHGLSLASYAGQNIRIAFKHNSNNKYQLWLDNIVVKTISNSFDVAAISNDIYKYSTPNTVNLIKATFKNNGSVPVYNLTLNYKLGNNAVVTELVPATLNYLDSKQLVFATPFISSVAAYYPLKIWVSAINGQFDQVPVNDTVSGSITLSTAIPTKKILVEEYTSALCGWCPYGYTTLQSIVNTNTNVIAASIHSNDQMAISAGTVLATDYNATEFPIATIDQYYFDADSELTITQTSWNTYINQRQAMIVPATVSVTGVSYNATTREINAIVSSNFAGNVKGDYRLNLYIKENNVFGDPNDLSDNQWNQYSYLHNISSSPYYQLGNYLNPTTYLLTPRDFKHQYVIDEMLDGPYGAAGIIPINGTTSGQTYTKTYTYTLSLPIGNELRYTADNIYLIGVLTEYNADPKQRTVLNTAEVKLTTNPETTVGITELDDPNFQFNVYPNPSSDVCYLNYTLKETQNVKVSLYNLLGELVYHEAIESNTGNNIHILRLTNLVEGTYSMVVSFKNKSVSKKLTLIK